MKNKKKKIVLATIIIILGIISYFFIDSYLFNKKEKKPKNYAYVNRPVVSGFKAGKDLNPSRSVYILTLRSEEEKNEKRLYNSYYVWQQYIE